MFYYCFNTFYIFFFLVFFLSFFFFNDTATTEIYTLSLHDALPIGRPHQRREPAGGGDDLPPLLAARSEEHTSELQSRQDLVCRLLLEKKQKNISNPQNGMLTKLNVCPRNGSIIVS